jgi:hypothetical protein
VDAIKDKNLKAGVAWIARALKYSMCSGELMSNWFLNQPPSTTRLRLKGAALFGEWCMKQGISPEAIASEKHPEVWLERCIRWIYAAEGSYTSADLCRTAVSALYRDWFGIKDVGSSNLLSLTLKSKAESRKPAGSKKRIWNIGVLLDGLKEEYQRVGLMGMKWQTLVGRVGVMLLLYTCCRINDMFNTVPERSVWTTSDNCMLLAMRTKVSSRRLNFKLIMHVEEKSLDPIDTIREYRRRTENFKDSQKFFFFQESGELIQSCDKLSADWLAPYVHEIGIPKEFTPYSIKTAVITALFNCGYSKECVSSFTGHSSNANTALRHYHDSSNKWLGHCLAALNNFPKEGIG